MDKDADEVVDALKAHFKVNSDTDLARKLRVDKRTVSAWRARKKVPQRFIGMLEGQSSHAVAVGPAYWSDHEQAAFALALFRYSRAFQDELNGDNFNQAFRIADSAFIDFWALMERAQSDLSDVWGVNSPASALALLIHDDIENREAMNKQSHRIMRENRPSITWTDDTVTDAKGRPARYP